MSEIVSGVFFPSENLPEDGTEYLKRLASYYDGMSEHEKDKLGSLPGWGGSDEREELEAAAEESALYYQATSGGDQLISDPSVPGYYVGELIMRNPLEEHDGHMIFVNHMDIVIDRCCSDTEWHDTPYV